MPPADHARACGFGMALRHRPLARRPHSHRRSGFSLMELMIAIVILGLGLIMAATMFPVAWTRARRLTEATAQMSITEAAHTTVKMLARVDGPQTSGSSFAGDLVFEPGAANDPNLAPGNPGYLVAYSDTRVHALHLENLSPMWQVAWEKPWLREQVDLPILQSACDPPEETDCDGLPFDVSLLFLIPQVRLESRLHPPLKARPRATYDERQFAGSDQHWDEVFDTSRYAWAVFHRLRKQVGPLEGALSNDGPGFNAQNAAQQAANDRREFDMYYVTLRRQNSTARYAQQDSRTAPDPTANPPVAAHPAALDPADDVLLPVPWRVQVYIAGPLARANNPTGIPSEIEINTGNAPTGPIVVDMFPPGADFIDEISGQVYRVVRRRIVGPDQDQAFLTLDREVLLEDVDFPLVNNVCGTCTPGVLDPQEHLRTVWVFPPPVEAVRQGDGTPIFHGKEPVVGIEMRTLSISPRK